MQLPEKRESPGFGHGECHISWMIRRELDEVIRIDSACFPDPWSKKKFIAAMRIRPVIGMVARLYDWPGSISSGPIGGYMIYRLHKKRLELLRLAVDPAMQRQGIGTAMIDRLKYKLTPTGRNRLTVEVRETNLAACAFLRAQRLWATSVLRERFEDTGEDAYLFNWRCLKEQPV